MLIDQEFLRSAVAADPERLLTVQQLRQALGQAVAALEGDANAVDADAVDDARQLLAGRAAKKAAYVRAYRKLIGDRRQEWLRRQAQVKPTARGILAVSERGSPLAAEDAAAVLERRHATSPPTQQRRKSVKGNAGTTRRRQSMGAQSQQAALRRRRGQLPRNTRRLSRRRNQQPCPGLGSSCARTAARSLIRRSIACRRRSRRQR